eukprot:TRINITY_DN19361_c0_g1_i1.p1 TRINITY_DN19361_c0_g1~~TRINITY_DN19361_c0_g1_i1.p1  ORF type:complete len:423 (+),score=99.53 TRINITY_DN19361_c0_g1_i1:59-1270(+)
MPQITPSDRLSDVKEYYFSRKLKEVASLRAQGRDIINLGIGSPDLAPHKDVVGALVDTAKGAANHGYQAYNGIPELRDGFSQFYKKIYKVELDKDKEVLPLMGSKEGILHITLAFANPQDAILAPNPGYAAYRSIAGLLNVTALPYNLTEATQWQPSLHEIKNLTTSYARDHPGKRVKILWVNYPHMPTGTEADIDTLCSLIQYCQKERILLVNDNPYSLVLPKGEPVSILKLRGSKDTCVELNSLSKSHNMPGWRVGVAVGKESFITSILQVKSNFDSGMFKGLQAAAAVALTSLPDNFHENLTAEYAARRTVVYDLLDTLSCTYSRNQVGLFVWARVPPTWTNVESKIDDILYKASVFITPGSIFGSNGEGYIRISLCCSTARLQEALARLQAYQNGNPKL